MRTSAHSKRKSPSERKLEGEGKVLITKKGAIRVFAPRPEIEAMKRRGIKL